MDKFKVTVTYEDQSKKIPLVVTPGRELTDFQREEAHKHLKRAVRSVFSLPPGAELGFYDRINGSRLTPRSFKTQSEVFPRRWTLVVESVPVEGANNTPGDISPPSTVKLDDNRAGSHVSGGSDDSSLDIMTTVFVHKVQPDGAAQRVGVREGDKVFSIGGERITSASHEDVVALLKMQEEELVMVVCPKADDVLQLSGFAAIGYGEPGEYDTKYGRAQVYEIDLGADSGDEGVEGHARQESESSLQSIDSSHRVTPEHESKSGAAVSDSMERGGRESSQSGSAHLVNSGGSSHEDMLHPPAGNTSASHEDVFIHAKLSELPVSPQGQCSYTRRKSPWAVGGDVHSMMLEQRSLAELTSIHQRNPSELSTESGELPDTSFQHLRQISDVSMDSVEDPTRRLSMEGRLFSEVELAQLGSNVTLPSDVSSRMLSELNVMGTEEGPLSLSPIDGQQRDSSQEPGCSSPLEQRRPSLRKPSLEDLTQLLEEGNSEALSPVSQLASPQKDNQPTESTLHPRKHSKNSFESEEATKRVNHSYSSRHQGRRGHRPSMIAALEEPIIKEAAAQHAKSGPSQFRTRGLSSLSAMEEAEETPEEAQRRPKRSWSMGTPHSGVARRPMPATSGHSVSLEHVDEVGKDEEEQDEELMENRQMQSQPEPSMLRNTPRPRPHSAGPGKMSLRYASYHGPLNRKVEKDDMGKRAHDRSWRSCYAVAKGDKLYFYKDIADAEQGGNGLGRPLEVGGAQVGIPEDYRKKPNVFRVILQSGLVMLFTADTSTSVRHWIETLRKVSGLDMDVNSLELSGYHGDTGPQSSLSNDLGDPLGGRGSKRSYGPGKDDSKKFLSKFKKLMTGNTNDPTTFGVPLEACPLSETHPFVPKVMDLCITEIEQRGLQCEGLYRMQGNGSVVNALISEMNKGNFDASSVSEEWQDIKVVTTLLKRFLKQLPDSLIIEGMYHDFITAARAPTDEGRVQRIKELVGQLPPAHFHTLRHFTVHLATIEKHSEHNKMTASNLAIVFGPTLLNSPDEEAIVKDMNASHKLIETMVLTHEELFDQPAPQVRVRRASDEPALTQPDSARQQAKTTKIPDRKSSSLSAATGLGVRKANRTQLTRDWVQKSDFQGSQEDSENEDTANSVQRRNVGSMWGKPQPQQHVKRRISQQLRHLNAGEGSLELPDSPTTPTEVRAKSRTFDGRQTSLTRKQSYAVAMGSSLTRDQSLSSLQPVGRTRSLSTTAAALTDKDLLKDFLGGGVKEPSHRMVYNFVTNESDTVRATSGSSSYNSPLTTYQESFL